MNLADAIEFHARSRPDHPAVLGDAIALTYRDLAVRLAATEEHFRTRGISREALIGVCLKDTWEHVVVIYTLARMGAVMLPLDWRWSTEEKERVVKHFKAAHVVVERDAEVLSGCSNLVLDQVIEIERQSRKPPVQGSDLPLLLSLSSGTTGLPKGPRITHDQMLRRFWTHWINLGLNSSDRYLSATPLYFGGGRTFAMSVLFSGGTLILFPPPFDAASLCDEITRREATSTFLVPTQLRKLLELPPERTRSLQRLKLLICSGAPLFPHEREAVRERVSANLTEYYASTEGGGVSIATPQDQQLYPDSVGRAVFAVEIQIVDENHRPLAPGNVGRLRYRGPGVASAYFANEAASCEAFRDGWFYPGDLAETNRSGYVFIRGRTKDVIIRGGVNIHPSEIETVICGHPAVAEAAVVGQPSKLFGEEVVAFVVFREEMEVGGLRDWCAGRLAPYKIPKEFIAVTELPRNSAGKVLKSDLMGRIEPY